MFKVQPALPKDTKTCLSLWCCGRKDVKAGGLADHQSLVGHHLGCRVISEVLRDQVMAPNDSRPIGTNYEDKGPKPERGRWISCLFNVNFSLSWIFDVSLSKFLEKTLKFCHQMFIIIVQLKCNYNIIGDHCLHEFFLSLPTYLLMVHIKTAVHLFD